MYSDESRESMNASNEHQLLAALPCNELPTERRRAIHMLSKIRDRILFYAKSKCLHSH